jgi:Ca2+-binding EF-hand superfamily protein
MRDRMTLTHSQSFNKNRAAAQPNRRPDSIRLSVAGPGHHHHLTKKAQDLSATSDALTHEEFTYYSEVFGIFDKDGSGAIDLIELQEAFGSMNMEMSESDLKVMIAGIAGHKEEVELPEFLKMVSIIKARTVKSNQLDLKEAFAAMDVDGNGFISASDLFKVLENIGESLPSDQIYEMLTYGDDDMDGKVGFDDFCRLMTGHN